MITQKETSLIKDTVANKLLLTRDFAAPPDKVWRGWTDAEWLDQWWAPKPWQAKTKSMDFREGGTWLYCMVGPEGPGSWCKANYITIDKPNSFTYQDAFCDETGKETHEFPSMHWKVEFLTSKEGTRVQVEISFETLADMEKILELGFEEGFLAAQGNLTELLAK